MLFRSDALLVLTEWPEFARIDPLEFRENIALRVVVDGRNVLDATRIAAAGLRYRGVGISVNAAVDTSSPVALVRV